MNGAGLPRWDSALAVVAQPDDESFGLGELTQAILDVAALVHPDGLIAFDASGVTGHPDHQCATAVATQVAATLGGAALGWTVPNSVAEILNAEFGSQFAGHGPSDIDVSITVDRACQRRALDLHPSQAVPGSVLWRRLDLLADVEYLRWLSRPGRTN